MSVESLFSLSGKVAIVTGAGRGIGRGIAEHFAQAGATVICAARTQADLDTTVANCTAAGGKALSQVCDVGQEEQLQALVERAQRDCGGLDIVVNNAGGAWPNDPLKTDAKTFNRDFDFNVTSAFNLCRLAHSELAKNRGNIINITSASARYAQKGFSSYGTAKAALTQLTRLLAADFAPAVRVNGISPGTIMTDALEQFLDEDTHSKMAALTPMQCLGEPRDIAAAALYLASPAARWVSGKIIEVDGGAESTTWPF